MKVLLLLLAYVCVAYAGIATEIHPDNYAEYEYAQPASVALEPVKYVEIPAQVRAPPQPGYSVGGALASIAKGAAEQAYTSLGSQHAAAGQAAYVAKNTLAQTAAQSAATAAAALAGKQIIVMGLEQQSRDAHVSLDSENLQLQQAQRATAAVQATAQQALQQVQVITAALNAAQATADHAAQAAAEASAELAAQTTMLGQAKARAEAIDEQLTAARVDYQTTQSAAAKAATAAQAAQSNAAAAAAKASAAASEVASRPAVHFPDPVVVNSVHPEPSYGYAKGGYHHP